MILVPEFLDRFGFMGRRHIGGVEKEEGTRLVQHAEDAGTEYSWIGLWDFKRPVGCVGT